MIQVNLLEHFLAVRPEVADKVLDVYLFHVLEEGVNLVTPD